MSELFEAHVAHVPGEELALYVLGALDPGRREAVERHVFACEACSDGLAREARIEAALEQVARLAGERATAAERDMHRVVSIVTAARVADVRAAKRSRLAGGIAGALAAAAALVLAFASATAPRSESAGVAQRAPGLRDAAGDMSGAFGAEVVLADTLDGG